MLLPDGVYRREGDGRIRFVLVAAPVPEELRALVQIIAERLIRDNIRVAVAEPARRMV